MSALQKEKEGTFIEQMAPDALLGLQAVMAELERKGFFGILGRYFSLKTKILLEKTAIIHYDRREACRCFDTQHTCLEERKDGSVEAEVFPFCL